MSDASAPQNRLEELLEQATRDESVHDRFLTALLNGELFVPGRLEGGPERLDGNYATLSDESALELLPAQLGGEEVVAAFTSPARLEEATEGRLPYVGLPVRVLLQQRPRNMKVVINPGVWHGKELLPDEIEALLSGGLATVAAGDEVMLGLPAERPEALIAALAEQLRLRPQVVSARLGQIFDPASAVPPHPLVGLELRDGARMEEVLAGVELADGPVDLVPLDGHPLGAWLRDHGEEVYRA